MSEPIDIEMDKSTSVAVHVVEFVDGILNCTLCRVGFRRHIVFRRHLLTRHMKEDSFVCTQCFDKFPTVAALEIHKLIHLARFEKRKSRNRRVKKVPEKVDQESSPPVSPPPPPPIIVQPILLPIHVQPSPQLPVNPQPIINLPKKCDIRPLSEALSAVANLTHPTPEPAPIRGPKVRKVNHRKVIVNGPLLGPVHENRLFQFYDPVDQQSQFYNGPCSSINLFDAPPVPPAPFQKFVCNYCGRCFKKETYLRYHLNSHAGFRPHMCNICGKSFTRVSILNKHRITVHHKNLYMGYNCSKCGKAEGFYKYLLLAHATVNSDLSQYTNVAFYTKIYYYKSFLLFCIFVI